MLPAWPAGLFPSCGATRMRAARPPPRIMTPGPTSEIPRAAPALPCCPARHRPGQPTPVEPPAARCRRLRPIRRRLPRQSLPRRRRVVRQRPPRVRRQPQRCQRRRPRRLQQLPPRLPQRRRRRLLQRRQRRLLRPRPRRRQRRSIRWCLSRIRPLSPIRPPRQSRNPK